jgi:1,4-alpha-glucan branching enzyme
MIKQKLRKGEGTASVTFSVTDDRPVSVIGDFNDWDPLRTPMAKRSNGRRSAVVQVPAGSELRFRYLADGGEFYDDGDADWFEANGYGGTHGVVAARGAMP